MGEQLQGQLIMEPELEYAYTSSPLAAREGTIAEEYCLEGKSLPQKGEELRCTAMYFQRGPSGGGLKLKGGDGHNRLTELEGTAHHSDGQRSRCGYVKAPERESVRLFF
jgi:hypothetical protein